jgi:hypothetical protein
MGEWKPVPAFLTLTLDICEWSVSRSVCFISESLQPGNNCIGKWEGVRTGLDFTEKEKSVAADANQYRPASL